MKLLAALLFGAASALQPAQVKPAAVDRRAAMKFTFPAAVAAALAPAAALAAKPPQLQSMQPPRRAKSGQIKTGNAGSIQNREAPPHARHLLGRRGAELRARPSPAAAAACPPSKTGDPLFPKAPGAAVRLKRGPHAPKVRHSCGPPREFCFRAPLHGAAVGHVGAARAQLRRLCRDACGEKYPAPPRAQRATAARRATASATALRLVEAMDATTAAPAAMASWRAITTAGTRFCLFSSLDGRALRRHQRRREQHKGAEHQARRELRRLTRPVAATRPARPIATPAAAGGERFAATARSCEAHARTAASSAGPASPSPPATAPRAVRCGSARCVGGLSGCRQEYRC